MAQLKGVTEEALTNHISKPSPALFLNPSLTEPGIFASLITNNVPIIDESTQPGEFKWNCQHPTYPTWGRTYGGVFVAQSIACALLSLDEPQRYYPHQLQSVFIRGGSESEDIQYTVTFLKKSPAFVNAQVHAYQKKKLLFTALISFVTPDEPNHVSHTFPFNKVDFADMPDPDTVPLYNHDLYNISRTGTMLKDPARQKMVLGLTLTMPVTTKLISRENADVKGFLAQTPVREPHQLLYVRYPISAESMFQPTDELRARYEKGSGNVVDGTNGNGVGGEAKQQKKRRLVTLEQQLNLIAMAYSSDYNVIPLLTRPHGRDAFPTNIQFSSLNHNITFNSPNVDIFNDWLIFDTSAPFLSNSRGQLLSTFYNRKGEAVALVAQESLARILEGNILDKFPNPMQVGNQMAKKTQEKNGGKRLGAFGMDLDKSFGHADSAENRMAKAKL